MSTFIVFAEDWQRHPSSTQHLICQIAQRHSVIWVNSIGLRSPRFNRRDLTRLAQKAMSLYRRILNSNRSTAVQGGGSGMGYPLAVLEPLSLPFHQYGVIRWLNRHLLTWQVRRCQQQNAAVDPEDVILWLALPSAACVIGAITARQVVYYCGDDFDSLAGVDHVTMPQLEAQLAQRADLILCASEELSHKFAPDRCQVVNHGVDLRLFTGQYAKPARLDLARPIAGFYGLLADWLDTSLLANLASQCPEWDFVLIGKHCTDLSAITACNNVHFIDAMPHQELVRYACHFQASLLPFKQCQQIEFCNPLKLREYLALGHPVLSVDFPALRAYANVVFTLNTVAEWAEQLRIIAQWTQPQRLAWQQQSRAAVCADSWRAKALQIESWLQLDPPAPAVAL